MTKMKLNRKLNIMDKRALVFFFPHNRKLRRDGDEFRMQAYTCKDWYEANGYTVDMVAIPKGKKWERRGFIMTRIEKYQKNELDRVLFFCHGSSKSFDGGFGVKNIHRLAHRIAKVAKPTATVTLFCCLTGKLPVGGLAETLSTCSGLRVFAHKTRGHTTKNPFKRVFHRGRMANLYPENREGLLKLKKHMWSSPDTFPTQFLESFALQNGGPK